MAGGGVHEDATASPAEPAPISSRDLLPHWVLQLDAPREELLRRTKGLAAAEEAANAATAAATAAVAAAAAAAVTAAALASGTKGAATGSGQQQAVAALRAAKKPGLAAGGREAGSTEIEVLRPSHNNERDFTRRYDAWRALVQEDAAELAARVSTARQAGTDCVMMIATLLIES
jgi:hypothetical protein